MELNIKARSLTEVSDDIIEYFMNLKVVANDSDFVVPDMHAHFTHTQ